QHFDVSFALEPTRDAYHCIGGSVCRKGKDVPPWFAHRPCVCSWDMKKTTSTGDRERALRDLYPSLSEGQLREVEENLARYVEVVLRIYERVRQDSPSGVAPTSLTGATNGGAMEAERSTNENNPFPTP